MDKKLKEYNKRLQEIEDISKTAKTKQKAKGKLSARERIEKLVDPGSFQEIDAFVKLKSHEFGLQDKKQAGDAAAILLELLMSGRMTVKADILNRARGIPAG